MLARWRSTPGTGSSSPVALVRRRVCSTASRLPATCPTAGSTPPSPATARRPRPSGAATTTPAQWRLTRTTGSWSRAARITTSGSPDSSGRKPRRLVRPGREVMTDFGGNDVAVSVAIDSQDRIVAAGDHPDDYFAVARYEPDGDLDGSFGDGGKVDTNFGSPALHARSMAIDSGGRIVVAGERNAFHWKFFLARYEPDGDLDGSFGDGGKVITGFGGSGYGSDPEAPTRWRSTPGTGSSPPGAHSARALQAQRSS